VADRGDLAFGLAHVGARSALLAARAALLPARVALGAPVIGGPLRRSVDDLAADGRRARMRVRAQAEQTVEAILSAPEVEQALDRLLAGPLTDAAARSLAEHRVVERVAVQILAAADLDRVIAAVLDHELTEQALDRALASPGLERLVVQVLESRLVDGLTDRVLQSPEMDRVVEHIATSPQVVEAVTQHTQTLAEEMVADVRRRTHVVDDVAERTVRGWLRRPRPSPS
jgi:DNA-binding PucR family transcriptional regulator